MKNERDVKAAVKKLLTNEDAWYFMPVMNGYGTHGIPDFLGACEGTMFAIETKFGNNAPTEMQTRCIAEMKEKGISVWVVSDRNFAEFSDYFSVWCEAIRACNKF